MRVKKRVKKGVKKGIKTRAHVITAAHRDYPAPSTLPVAGSSR